MYQQWAKLLAITVAGLILSLIISNFAFATHISYFDIFWHKYETEMTNVGFFQSMFNSSVLVLEIAIPLVAMLLNK